MAQENLRNFETFRTSLVPTDEKIDNVLNDGAKLVGRGIFPTEKIQNKCEQLKQR